MRISGMLFLICVTVHHCVLTNPVIQPVDAKSGKYVAEHLAFKVLQSWTLSSALFARDSRYPTRESVIQDFETLSLLVYGLPTARLRQQHPLGVTDYYNRNSVEECISDAAAFASFATFSLLSQRADRTTGIVRPSDYLVVAFLVGDHAGRICANHLWASGTIYFRMDNDR